MTEKTYEDGLIEGPLERFRCHLSRRFPGLLDRVMEGYLSFSGKGPEEDDAKEFSAHHGACKAALAHLDLLIKLAAWAEKKRSTISPKDEETERLIDQAQTALCDRKKDAA